MIDAMELSRLLDAHDISDAFHNTYCPVVAGTVRTYCAHIIIGYHHAVTAIPHLVAERIDRRREMMHVLLGLLQQMQGQTQSTPAAHSGKGADRIHRFLKKF